MNTKTKLERGIARLTRAKVIGASSHPTVPASMQRLSRAATALFYAQKDVQRVERYYRAEKRLIKAALAHAKASSQGVAQAVRRLERRPQVSTPDPYPLCRKLGIEVAHDKDCYYCPSVSLRRALAKKGKRFTAQFRKHFGVQTCNIHGPYPWDVEAVLERMINKRLTGSQLIWD